MKNKKYFGEWGLDAWKRTHKRDLIKTKWAKDNGYTLLRIPYTKFNKIEQILEKTFKKLGAIKPSKELLEVA